MYKRFQAMFHEKHLKYVTLRTYAPILLLLALLLSCAASARADDTSSLLQADQDFVRAFQQKDAAAAATLLSPDFSWIDPRGKRPARALLEALPTVANADVSPSARIYGNSAVVRADQGKMHVLRIWTKTANGWRILLYQEVKQVENAGRPRQITPSDPSKECINPCKEIPYKPATNAEKEALAAWLGGVMTGFARSDVDLYSPSVADEFTATDTFNVQSFTKADRLAQMQKMKATGRTVQPQEVVSAEMFDLGETVVAIPRERGEGGENFYNTRVFAKRDGRWQMVISFNTRLD